MESLSAHVLDMKPPSPTSSLPRPSLSMTQMLLLNAVVCGVEICACAGFTYVPPLLLKAGYSEENLGYILGLGPLLGFFFVPVIGRASDRCYSQFGRRRPFILGLAVLLVVSLYLVPFGEYFASLVVTPPLSRRLGVWGLSVGVVLLDFTTQACLTPCEALLNDATCESQQTERIFSIYSLMISMGGIIGYLLTAIDWANNPLGQYFGGQEASVFSILIITFTLLLSATLFVAKEVPLTNSPADISTVSSSSSSSLSLQACAEPLHSPSSSPLPRVPISIESGYETSGESSDDGSPHSPILGLHSKHKPGHVVSHRGTRRLARRVKTQLLLCVPRLACQVSDCCYWLVRNLVPSELMQVFKIPAVLKLLAIADFFSWTAIMGFNIYFSDYVGQVSGEFISRV